MQYPNHIQKTAHKVINYANRGMDLEEGATTLIRNNLVGGHNAI